MPPVRQPSFSAGEIAPALHARVDLDTYGHALKRCRNFFVSKDGSAVSRPGTKFICRVKDDSKIVRLVGFRYSDDTSYVLEFGHQYIRWIRNGAQMLESAVPMEKATTYTEAELREMDFAQSGDVLFITHKSHAPATLSRTGTGLTAAEWLLADISFAVPSYFGAATYRLTASTLVAEDSGHPGQEWSYQITAVGRTLTGMLVESMPVDITLDSGGGALPSELVVYPDTPIEVAVSGTLGTLPSNIQTFVGYRIYRGRAGTYGFVGEKRDADQVTTWKDYGQTPDESIQPPKGRNPFRIDNSAGTQVRIEEPRAVCFYDDRLTFAGTVERPGHIFQSQVGSYLNFDERVPSVADEALEYELAARTRETIRRVLPQDRLFVFTDASVWAISGTTGPLSATDLMNAARVSKVGSADVPPLEIDDAVIYVRTKGAGVMNLQPSERGIAVQRLSALASHLFQKRSIIDWAYAEDPWGVVWAVRSDGRLLSLTFLGGGMAAWAWHDTATSEGASQLSTPTHKFESVVSVPETTEDGVYLAVQRVANGSTIRTIERMTDRLFTEETDVSDIVCLDASYTYTGASTSSITGLTWLAGRTVYVNGNGEIQGPFTVSGLGVVNLTTAVTKAHVGLLYYPELESLNFHDGRTHRKTVAQVFLELYASAGVKVGADFDDLSPWSEGTAAETLVTDLAEVPVQSGWSTNAPAALRQTLPWPVTVISLIRDLEVGGGG